MLDDWRVFIAAFACVPWSPKHAARTSLTWRCVLRSKTAQQLKILLLQGIAALGRRLVLRHRIRDAVLKPPVHLLGGALEAPELVGRGDQLCVQVVVLRRQSPRLAGEHLDLRTKQNADASRNVSLSA